MLSYHYYSPIDRHPPILPNSICLSFMKVTSQIIILEAPGSNLDRVSQFFMNFSVFSRQMVPWTTSNSLQILTFTIIFTSHLMLSMYFSVVKYCKKHSLSWLFYNQRKNQQIKVCNPATELT